MEEYTLEVVMAHFFIMSIALHAFQASVCEILTGVIIFAGRFAR
jgi:hypothetical protein